MKIPTVFASLAPLSILALTACGSAPAARDALAQALPAPSAHIVLSPASASQVTGQLTARPTSQGVRITGEVRGLSRGGAQAIHIHEKGDCSAPDATSAGSHFNPGNQAHGKSSAGVHHGGDMDNIVANASGVAQVDVQALGVTLGSGAVNDIAGRALLVHAQADDYRSQPAGNAGARVACGVVTVTQ